MVIVGIIVIVVAAALIVLMVVVAAVVVDSATMVADQSIVEDCIDSLDFDEASKQEDQLVWILVLGARPRS